jgi:pimeloyl-ACP methyl ester carboxylesterase
MHLNLVGRVVGYEEWGRGRPVVLIHGFPLNRFIWQAQGDDLASVAHILAPDLRGFGESDMGTGDVTIATYADDVREFLDALGVREPVVICGLSMGGYIALAYLRRYPDHVAALVLANTKATPDSLEARNGRDKSIATAREQGVEPIAAGMLPKMLTPATFETRPELVEQVKRIMTSATVPGVVAALAAMRDRPDSTGTLLEFSAPTLVIAGAEDPLMPMAEAENMKQAARNGQLVVIPGAAHLSSMEQPQAFNAALLDFLQTLNY